MRPAITVGVGDRLRSVVELHRPVIVVVMSDPFPVHHVVFEGEGRLVGTASRDAKADLTRQRERLAEDADEQDDGDEMTQGW